MQIERLRLKNFRCYDELDIDFEPRLTVIVGENGKGKTAIFDALAMALEPYLRAFNLPGKQLTSKDVRRVPIYKADGLHIDHMHCQYPASIELDVHFQGSKTTCSKSISEAGVVENCAEIVSCGQNLCAALHSQPSILLPAFAYYGTARIWFDSRLMNKDTEPLAQRSVGYEECLEPSSSYSSFGRWFRKLQERAFASNEQNAAEHALIQKAVLRAIDACLESTGLRDLYYNKELDTFVISHPDTGEMIVEDLSDGFRSVLSMVADLAYRMVRLNPQLGERAVVDTPGVVFIDEIDMHLHPLWQQTVLPDLMRAFPQVQFIVTTHSPQVLSSVPPESVRVLVWGRKFEGVRRVNFALGASSAQILQDIQNVTLRSERLPIVQQLKRYLELVGEDKWDSDEAKELRKELDAWSHGNEPALLRADMDIRMRQFRRKRS
ncbi:MAG: AAA family ATPase [Phascolarctobacterium sp.]|nr:AAA family ATPase [Phascolarctobacterium sp.]